MPAAPVSVSPDAAVQEIIANATIQAVIATLAGKAVIAVAAFGIVIAKTAQQRIVADATFQRVVAAKTIDLVVATLAQQIIAIHRIGAKDLVIAAQKEGALQQLIPRSNGIEEGNCGKRIAGSVEIKRAVEDFVETLDGSGGDIGDHTTGKGIGKTRSNQSYDVGGSRKREIKDDTGGRGNLRRPEEHICKRAATTQGNAFGNCSVEFDGWHDTPLILNINNQNSVS